MGEETEPPETDAVNERRRSGRASTRAPQQTTEAGSRGRWTQDRLTYVLVAYIVIAVSALVVLRAVVHMLDFMSIGWIIVLAILPLLPWLLPRFGEFLRTISPYVQSFKLGGIELQLREVQSQPISVSTSGILASVPNDVTALSSGTGISSVMASLRELRRQGGSPAGIIDLQDGHKWRLPNLYFLARLLEIEPVVAELMFTETRGGTDGYLVGTCSPAELRSQIEQSIPSYAAAGSGLRFPNTLDLTNPAEAQKMGDAFLAFHNAMGVSSGSDDDPVRGYVTSKRVAELVGLMSRAAIEALGRSLTEQDLRMVVEAPYRFVPTTTGGRLAGLIDQNAVALAVARATIARS